MTRQKRQDRPAFGDHFRKIFFSAVKKGMLFQIQGNHLADSGESSWSYLTFSEMVMNQPGKSCGRPLCVTFGGNYK
jgi:hypothetical protein